MLRLLRRLARWRWPKEIRHLPLPGSLSRPQMCLWPVAERHDWSIPHPRHPKDWPCLRPERL